MGFDYTDIVRLTLKKPRWKPRAAKTRNKRESGTWIQFDSVSELIVAEEADAVVVADEGMIRDPRGTQGPLLGADGLHTEGLHHAGKLTLTSPVAGAEGAGTLAEAGL